MINVLRKVFMFGHAAVIFFFVAGAFALIFFAAGELWHGISPAQDTDLRHRFNAILESIALLTIAVASLELGQTILEEELVREAQMSAPTRVRRFLSRFMVVVIVALSIECLVAVFQLIHENPAELPNAAAVGVAAAALLAAWGVFVKLNKAAEELEPEAMQRAKSEDRKIEGKAPRSKSP